MADLTAIQKVVDKKADDELSKDFNDLIAVFKTTSLYKKLEANNFKTGQPFLEYKTEVCGKLYFRHLIERDSKYMKDLKEWLRPVYKQEQADILVKKFENLTDIL